MVGINTPDTNIYSIVRSSLTVSKLGITRGMVANPARSQLKTENTFSFVPVRAWGSSLVRQVRLSRPSYLSCPLGVTGQDISQELSGKHI